MEETILFPSPNWFLSSILGVSEDGWLVYGGPGKTLIVLEPLSSEFDGVFDSPHRYKAHVVNKSHTERVVSVDISPQWSEKKQFITGSSDGVVKEWTLVQDDNKWTIKNIHSSEAHASEKEEVVCVGYSKATHVISIGNFCNLVVWELNTNVTKTFSNFMKSFKATCMSCSPHSALVVAVGTKQGVVFVLDLNGKGNITYKVRGQDDEVSQVAWCPQYEVLIQKSLNEVVKKSVATQRLENIRNEPESEDLESTGVEKNLPDIQKSLNEDVKKSVASQKLDNKQNEPEPKELESSGVEKNLPDDSFEESLVVQEDDMFDIYKDHEASEFGHKKYEPEDIVIKVKNDSKKDDFLAECERLKAQILKNKNEEEESIETLVAAMDKAHVGETSYSKSSEEAKPIPGVASLMPSGSKHTPVDSSAHVHKHLLATMGKLGSVRIWSKTGKIVASCVIYVNNNKSSNKQSHNAFKGPNHASISWYKPDTLLIADGKMHVFECNPLQIDCRNKLHWRPLHSIHRRGLYCITTNAPRVQTAEMLSDPRCDEQWSVWTTAQDRYLIKYDVKTKTVQAKFGTCGGFLYNVSPCPYDAGKLAVGVGDGSIRIWETQTTGEDDSKLSLGEVHFYWQQVQGKVLQCAWHPTKENLLAFSTAESRVGLIDTSSKFERPARVFPPALSKGVYTLVWGENMSLFAAGGNELVMFQANKPDDAPIPINIEIEGQIWEPSALNYSHRGLMVGSNNGGVAIFSGPGGQSLAAKFVVTKMIESIEWHPQQTSSSDEESKYKDLVAISSVDRNNTIVILKYEDKEEGGKQFTNFNSLVGHTNTVLQVYWNPHRDGQLLSTSVDGTVRVWDAIIGACLSIFEGHSGATMGAAWCPQPQLADCVISGGGDSTLRIWSVNNHPAENYKPKRDYKKQKKIRPRKKRDVEKIVEQPNEKATDDDNKAEDEPLSDVEVERVAEKLKEWKFSDSLFTKFLLPLLSKQVSRTKLNGTRIILQKYLENNKEIKNILDIMKEEDAEMYDLEFLKMFGTINDVNEVLDKECQNHLQLKVYDAYMMLMIIRGHIDTVIQFANERDILDSFLLSIAPSVSAKFWKDATRLYVAQIDRLAVKKNNDRLTESKSYGGMFYRQTAALLSVHDIKGAVEVLVKSKLFKEAYVLCRCRHMDSIAEETLSLWAQSAAFDGNLMLSALIHIALGNVAQAANVLRRSNQQEYLNLAADLAKSAGLNIFADFMEEMSKSVKDPTTQDQTEPLLEQLPTRIQLLMKETEGQHGELKTKQDVNQIEVANGTNSSSDSDDVSKCEE